MLRPLLTHCRQQCQTTPGNTAIIFTVFPSLLPPVMTQHAPQQQRHLPMATTTIRMTTYDRIKTKQGRTWADHAGFAEVHHHLLCAPPPLDPDCSLVEHLQLALLLHQWRFLLQLRRQGAWQQPAFHAHISVHCMAGSAPHVRQLHVCTHISHADTRCCALYPSRARGSPSDRAYS